MIIGELGSSSAKTIPMDSKICDRDTSIKESIHADNIIGINQSFVKLQIQFITST